MRSVLKNYGFAILLLGTLMAPTSCYPKNSYSKPTTSVSSFFSEKDFNSFFPIHNNFYSYKAFIKAISNLALIRVTIERRGDFIYKITRTENNIEKIVRQDKDWDEPWAKSKTYSSSTVNYSDFCFSKNLLNDKKELAAFFAHVAHETRNGRNGAFDDGLMLISEKDTNANYAINNAIYPAVNGKKYYGRGPLQLSYNSNYGFASECIFGNKQILLDNPQLLDKDAVQSFETAIFFWMTPQGIKPSCHEVIKDQWKPSLSNQTKGYTNGFGMTINIINGALECGGKNLTAMQNRIDFYQHFLKLFNIKNEKCSCSCEQMIPFPG